MLQAIYIRQALFIDKVFQFWNIQQKNSTGLKEDKFHLHTLQAAAPYEG